MVCLPADQNQDDVWSDGGTGQPVNASFDWEKAFNGVITDPASDTSAMPLAVEDGGTGEMSWTGKIDTSGKNVILYYWYQNIDLDKNYIEINNSKISLFSPNAVNNTVQQVNISAEAGNEITQMKIVRTNGANWATGICGISVDGKLLVNATGQTKVTGPLLPRHRRLRQPYR